ncbi:molecular chaperone Tir [Paraburkholderia sp. Ac-20336]|uniref:CesT family type III secretion system chaperone n=1 Tax=Burkholderiaceae TaxID=119060 RepID=UPI00141F7394|nr:MULTISPECIES: CesT family type III secretion system chaperone [Burkholderiaceae]MBN3807411.1 molecular chaperone Tir [Paraburkholderia sp. Ac-20336]MBN3851618.1 molecular chaperone Tir [Paraburkholderia sp. Ac-20342]NIF54073.1 molecular chaperone Tir [Burkholderia sp. Ax-1724]NIF81726.1 molecular chaperone Tir [Paraburkholderia sp. Cy-641]
MSRERFVGLIHEICDVVGLPDAEYIVETQALEIEGFDVRLDHHENDPDSIYVCFHYGTVTAGRTLVVFRLMLEANLLIYAQDQAQLCLDSDTGSIVLLVRVVMGNDVTGEYLADVFAHYAEHGRYWQNNILASGDEMFEGIAAGNFMWLRA